MWDSHKSRGITSSREWLDPGFFLALRGDPDYAQTDPHFCRRILMRFFLVGLICSCGVAGPDEVAAAKLQTWWSDLGSLDGAKAYRARWSFMEKPEATIPFFEKQLAPVEPADPKLLEQLLKDLRSENFKARARANLALEKLDLLAKDALIHGSKEDQPLESRRRIEELLQNLNGPKRDPDSLRAVRAAEILEMIGNKEAEQLLKRWAGGAAAALLTQEARDTLERLARRPPPHPLAPIKPGAARDVDGDPLPAGAIARLGTTRFRIPRGEGGHGFMALFTPDQKEVALLAGDSLHFIDASTGKLVRQFEELARHVAVSPDGKTLVTADTEAQNGTSLTIRDWPSYKEISVIRYSDTATVTSLAFIGPKTLVTTNDDNTVRQWSLDSKKETLRKPFFGNFRREGAQLSADGKVVAVKDGLRLYLWEWQSDKPPRQIKSAEYTFGTLAFSPDARTLATVNTRWAIHLWDVPTGRLLRRLHSPDVESFYALVFSPDGRTLATTTYSGREVCLWNLETGKCQQTLSGYYSPVARLVFSADGKQVAAANAQDLQVWDLQTGRLRQEELGHFFGIEGLAFSPRGGVVASIGEDGTARLWEARTGKQLHILRHEAERIRALAFAPDGSRLATSSFDDTVRLWDSEKGRQIFKFAGHGKYGGQRRLAFTRDGRQLLSWGDDYFLRAFDLKSAKAVVEHRILPKGLEFPDEDDAGPRARELQGRKLMSMGLRGLLAPDVPLFALSEQDGDFVFFDVQTGKERSRLGRKGMRFFASVQAFSPNQKFLLIAPHSSGRGPDSVEIWHLPSAKLVQSAPLPGRLDDLSWAPDSRSFAAVHGGKVTLWEMASAQVRVTMDRFGAPAQRVAFSHDGQLLVVGLTDSTSLVMDLAKLAAGPRSLP
jgi:WD40 repeat protein